MSWATVDYSCPYVTLISSKFHLVHEGLDHSEAAAGVGITGGRSLRCHLGSHRRMAHIHSLMHLVSGGVRLDVYILEDSSVLNR